MRRRYRPAMGLNPLRGKSQLLSAILLALLPLVALLQGWWIVRHPQAIRPWLMHIPTERVKCDYCGGTGVVRAPDDDRRLDPCPICFGVGGHYVRKLSSNEVLCPACAGMGRVLDIETGAARSCMRCGGRGLIRVSDASHRP